jgi:hypothetical protein
VASLASARDPWTGPRPAPGDCVNVGFAVDWLFLRRDNPERIVVAQEINNTTLTLSREFSTEDVDFEYVSGYRFLAGMELCSSVVLEAAYFNVGGWGNSGAFNIQPSGGALTFSLQSPFLNLNGPLVPGYRTAYDSDLQSAEAGVRLLVGGECCCLSGSLLGGFRHLNIDENFLLTGSQTDLAGNTVATERTVATTTNNLYGIQFGGDFTYAMGEFLYFTLFGKGGVYVNDAGHRIVNILGTATTAPFRRLDVDQRESVFAASVEAGLTLNIRIAECALLRGGYQVLYVGGLALAPEQLEANRTLFDTTIRLNNVDVFPNRASQMDRQGATIYHGVSLGLEVSF